MAVGLLNKYLGINNVMTPRQWEGLGGLSAGLLAAGAPRVGAPGPNAWGAGFTQMGQSVKDYDTTQRGIETQDLQKKLLAAQASKAEAEAARLKRQQLFKERLLGINKTPQASATGAGVGPVQISPLPNIPGSSVIPGQPTESRMSPPMSQAEQQQQQMQSALGPLTPQQHAALLAMPEEDFSEFIAERLFQQGMSEGQSRLVGKEMSFKDAYDKKIEEDMAVIDTARTADAIFMTPATPEQAQQQAEHVAMMVGNGSVVVNGPDGKPMMTLSPSALDDPNAAGDIALVFTFMKSLDPRSTVREGEFQMASGIGGWADRVQSWFSEISGKGKLTGDQRRQIMRAIRSQALKSQNEVAKANESYREYLRRYSDMGVNVDRTVPQYKPRPFGVPSSMFGGNAYTPPGRGG